MTSTKIKAELQKLTNHPFVQLTTRGDTAIAAALSLLPNEKTLLIPEEGGWLSYRTIPKEQHLAVQEVKCIDSVIDRNDLRLKLSSGTCSALLYQNPGGYFAEQPMKEIYDLCKEHNCLVIMDVSGALGTKLCDGRYADILVCSFGKWKLVEAHTGGFISCNEKSILNKLTVKEMIDESKLKIILEKLNQLPDRINFLVAKRKKIMKDLAEFGLIHQQNVGFVVIVKFCNEMEKQNIINYCTKNNLPYRECPRYIRINQKAISIEVKQLLA